MQFISFPAIWRVEQPTPSGEDILIADTAQAFAHAVMRVLKDESLARRLGQNGRQTVAEKNDGRVIYPAWDAVYRGLS